MQNTAQAGSRTRGPGQKDSLPWEAQSLALAVPRELRETKSMQQTAPAKRTQGDMDERAPSPGRLNHSHWPCRES